MCELSDERDEAPFCDQDQLQHRSPYHAVVHFNTQFHIYFQLRFNLPERGLQLLLDIIIELICKLDSQNIHNLKKELPSTIDMLKRHPSVEIKILIICYIAFAASVNVHTVG